MLDKIIDNKFLALANNIPNVSIQGYDKERNVIYWNKASETIYGYTQEEALGKKLEDLIIPTYLKAGVVSHINDWYKKGVAIPAAELPLEHKDGSTVHVYSSHVMLGEGTDNPEMFSVDIDVSKQRQEKE